MCAAQPAHIYTSIKANAPQARLLNNPEIAQQHLNTEAANILIQDNQYSIKIKSNKPGRVRPGKVLFLAK
jgi:hypothetical protein